jgi:Caspase domain
MRRLRLSLAAILLIAASALHAAAAGKRVALVIGNGTYVNAPQLANPVNDADDMAAALTGLGFTVILGRDLDKAGFDRAAREFAAALENADTGLVFYAGHGLQVGGQNFLVPVDAKLSRERDLDFEAVRLDFLLRQMELDGETRTNIVILDACRDNPLARNLARSMGTRSAGIGAGLAEVQTGVGTFIAYSTQPGNVALDGRGRNSPFAEALLHHVKDAGQTLTAVMIAVRREVLAGTGGKQVPWDHSALTGDFYFNLAAAPQAVPPPGAVKPGSDALDERIKKLEAEVKRRKAAAALASNAALVELRQRLRQLEGQNRSDLDRLFRIQREQGSSRDPQTRMTANEEIGRIQIEMVRRNKDIAELKGEIDKVERDAGLEPETAEGGEKGR